MPPVVLGRGGATTCAGTGPHPARGHRFGSAKPASGRHASRARSHAPTARYCRLPFIPYSLGHHNALSSMKCLERCGAELWVAAGAPKERNRIEQDRPAAALTGRNRERLSRPFRAGPVEPAEPRALPWAIPCEPFRLQRQSPCLQFRPTPCLEGPRMTGGGRRGAAAAAATGAVWRARRGAQDLPPHRPPPPSQPPAARRAARPSIPNTRFITSPRFAGGSAMSPV